MEQVGIKIIPSCNILFAWLLALDNTRYNEKDNHNTTGETNDSDVYMVHLIQDTWLLLF